MANKYINEIRRQAFRREIRKICRWIKYKNLLDSYNPAEKIKGILMQNNITLTSFADAMDMSISSCHCLTSGKSKITVDRAIRLSYVLGEKPEYWLQIQYEHDLRNVKINKKKLSKLNICAIQKESYFTPQKYLITD